MTGGFENNGASWVYRDGAGKWLGDVSLAAGHYGQWRTANPRRRGKGYSNNISATLKHVEGVIRSGIAKAEGDVS